MEVFRRSEKRCIDVQERAVSEAYHERREREERTRDLFRAADEDGSVAAFGVLVTVMQKVPLSKPLKYHDKSHKKSLSH